MTLLETAAVAFAMFSAVPVPQPVWNEKNMRYALCAVRLCPAAAKAVLASHVSAEPAGMLLLDALRKKPLITAGMRLGEGTGAVAAMPLLDMARAVDMDCYTFEEGGIEAYTPQGGEG